MLTVGTTFSGIGAPEQALKNLGIKHIVKWACDIDKYAKQTYLANHTCEKWYDDITKIDLNTLGYVDLYVFGFPCTSISNAGTRKMEEGSSGLVKYSLDILDKIQPKYFIFENVAALLQKNAANFLKSITDRLTINYNFQYKVLNTKNFGLPQNRQRVFCVGIRKDIQQEFIFPSGNNNILKLRDFLDVNVDNKYYISNERLSTFLPNTQPYKSDIIFAGGLRYGKLRETRKYGVRTNYPQTKQVYSIDGIAITLTLGKDVGYYIMDDKRIRCLTPNERIRLQGFPSDFIFPVKESSIVAQMGNTITVNVLEAIFNNLLIDYVA